MTKILMAVLVLVGSCGAHAEVESQLRSQYDNFYTISEKQKLSAPDVSPLQAIEGFFAEEGVSGTLKEAVLNLLSFEHHQNKFGDFVEPYQRLKHYGTWVRDESQGDCLNTRARVLVRDSYQEVTYSSGGCSVTKGAWHDPYTDHMYYRASDVQIDHVVPLKNSYVSGAHRWDYARRCLYANSMGNVFHLIAVDGYENMKKGDAGPDRYMPPNENFQCEYLSNWVKIKLIWQLELNPDEAAAVQKLAKVHRCSLQMFAYKTSELRKQRQWIQQNKDLCAQQEAVKN